MLLVWEKQCTGSHRFNDQLLFDVSRELVLEGDDAARTWLRSHLIRAGFRHFSLAPLLQAIRTVPIVFV